MSPQLHSLIQQFNSQQAKVLQLQRAITLELPAVLGYPNPTAMLRAMRNTFKTRRVKSDKR